MRKLRFVDSDFVTKKKKKKRKRTDINGWNEAQLSSTYGWSESCSESIVVMGLPTYPALITHHILAHSTEFCNGHIAFMIRIGRHFDRKYTNSTVFSRSCVKGIDR